MPAGQSAELGISGWVSLQYSTLRRCRSLNLRRPLLHRFRLNPLLNTFNLMIDPVVLPVDSLGVPRQQLSIGIAKLGVSSADVFGLEDIPVVQNEWQVLIECLF